MYRNEREKQYQKWFSAEVPCAEVLKLLDKLANEIKNKKLSPNAALLNILEDIHICFLDIRINIEKKVLLEFPNIAGSASGDTGKIYQMIPQWLSRTTLSRTTAPDSESRPLYQYLPRIFLESPIKDTGKSITDNLAEAREDEFLIVLPDPGAGISTIMDELSFHATYTIMESGRDKDKSYYLFHVKDDYKRYSTLCGLRADGTLSNSQFLKCYESNEWVIFLPEKTQKVGKHNLNLFCSFLKNAAPLFGFEKAGNKRNLLAAITANEPLSELFYLGGLDFVYHQAELTTQRARDTRFKIVSLEKSDAAIENLKEELRHSPHGYRLELTSTRYVDRKQANIKRLLERKKQIEYQVKYIKSLNPLRPRLFRYSQQQLTEIAQMLCSISKDTIKNKHLEYAFQSEDTFERGYHFFFTKTVEEKTSGLFLSSIPMGRTVRFWLDPFWAVHYYNEHSKSLVFVPYGMVLSPTLHAWEKKDSHTTLRETINHWFYHQLKGREIPEEPVYIFDLAEEPGEIEIFLLDRKQFQPYTESLGIINDNLKISDAVYNDHDFMAGLKYTADRIRWVELIRQIEKMDVDIRQKFDETVEETASHISGEAGELAAILTREINELVDRTTIKAGEMVAIEKELREWLITISEMKDALKKIKEKKEELEKKIAGSKNQLSTLINETKKTLDALESSRAKLESDITGQIVKIQDTKNNLKIDLTHLKFWGD
jgi:hypothetical protein